MKDQNTPTNTLESLHKVLNRKFDCTHCGWALQVLDKDFQDINKAVEDLVSQAVNKARIDEIRRYDHMTYRSREEHDTYLQDRIAELNRDETPNQTEGETSPLGGKV